MRYDRMPLYPQPSCRQDGSLRVPLFDRCDTVCLREACAPRECCQTVRLENPACPGEFAEVRLCVDECGSLSICVHRLNRPCPPRRDPCRRPWQ